ncbi:jg3213, partial [Pararge aegeria aegeria]
MSYAHVSLQPVIVKSTALESERGRLLYPTSAQRLNSMLDRQEQGMFDHQQPM